MLRTIFALQVGLAIIIALTGCEKKPATYDEALALSARTGRPVLVDFYTEW